MSYGVNGFRADSCNNWAPFVLVAVVALFMVLVFICFFQKFPNFCGQICGLGLIRVRFSFTKFLPSVMRTCHGLHSKALVFLYAFEESVDCHLLSSFCDDSNLHISLLKYVLSTMGVSKESISKFLIGNRFHVKLRILSPENCKQSLQVKS